MTAAGSTARRWSRVTMKSGSAASAASRFGRLAGCSTWPSQASSGAINGRSSVTITAQPEPEQRLDAEDVTRAEQVGLCNELERYRLRHLPGDSPQRRVGRVVECHVPSQEDPI